MVRKFRGNQSTASVCVMKYMCVFCFSLILYSRYIKTLAAAGMMIKAKEEDGGSYFCGAAMSTYWVGRRGQDHQNIRFRCCSFTHFQTTSTLWLMHHDWWSWPNCKGVILTYTMMFPWTPGVYVSKPHQALTIVILVSDLEQIFEKNRQMISFLQETKGKLWQRPTFDYRKWNKMQNTKMNNKS